METGITKNQILSELSKSPHGNYRDYLPVCQRATKEEPEFLAHLISWNRDNGEIRDSKVALPVISLSVPDFAYAENSLAHLALLDPRNLLKAIRFQKEIKTTGHERAMVRMVKQYLRYRESDWKNRFTPTAVRFRDALKDLYWLYRVHVDPRVSDVLWGGVRGQPKPIKVKGTVFEGIERLKEMSANEAASFIVTNRIPFLTAKAALGERIGEPDILRALVERMSPTELTTNAKLLEKLGMKNLPAVRGAFEKSMARAAKSTKNVLKTTKAVEAVEDEVLKERLRGLQERQISRLATVEGNWVVLGDKSGSMAPCIEAARHVAGTLTKMVSGKVYLVFFDTAPRFMDVSGKIYEEIKAATSTVQAGGGTSIGCGLQYLIDRNISVDGIAIVSDAQENSAPVFVDRYKRYVQTFGNEPAVYLYRCGHYTGRMSRGYAQVNGLMIPGTEVDLRDSMAAVGLDLQEFQLGESVDYYSLPGIARSMTVKKYGLIEQVMDTPLMTLEMVFGGKFESKRKERVHA